MHKNLFDHLLVTRFSYRQAESCSVEIDPLDRYRLAKRFDIFEAVCFPSVLEQRENNFTWILIIDAQLPSNYHDRLVRLISGHEYIRLHIFTPETQIKTLDWLSDYLNPVTEYVLTTALDDDDALCTDYVEKLHDHIHNMANANTLSDIKVFGCTKAIQWDYCPTRKSPLGYLKPWLRRRTSAGAFPLQSGFSVLSRKQGLNVSAYYFRHSIGDLYLIPDTEFNRLSHATRKKIQTQRTALKKSVADISQDWNQLCIAGAFSEINPNQPCVLMVNTVTNLQNGRLFEHTDQRRSVIDESSFPGFAVDLEAVQKSIAFHGCTLSNFLASVLPIYKETFRVKLIRSPAQFVVKLKYAIKITLLNISSMQKLRD